MDVILSGGPRHGSIFEVQRPTPVIQVAMPEPIDITTFGDIERQVTMSFRRGEYRPRGRYRCGEFARDAHGHVIYDYRGTY